MTSSLLLTNAYIHSVADPYANAMHLENGVISWLGASEAAERMLAATTTTPVESHDFDGLLITPAFIDGFSTHALQTGDERFGLSSTTKIADAVYYGHPDEDDTDGIYVPAENLDQLGALLGQIKPPTQLLIESTGPDTLTAILSQLSEQKNSSLMRSRHRIVLNHTVTDEHIALLVKTHSSVTVIPDVQTAQPQFHAPLASLIAQGVHVAAGTGEWTDSIWHLLTAMIEHSDQQQRISTRAAFNTVTRDGIRVLPSRIAQAQMGSGQIAAGSPADLNVWHAQQLGVQAPDVKAAHWSTDKRAGTALLPILESTETQPQLRRVIRNGRMS